MSAKKSTENYKAQACHGVAHADRDATELRVQGLVETMQLIEDTECSILNDALSVPTHGKIWSSITLCRIV